MFHPFRYIKNRMLDSERLRNGIIKGGLILLAIAIPLHACTTWPN